MKKTIIAIAVAAAFSLFPAALACEGMKTASGEKPACCKKEAGKKAEKAPGCCASEKKDSCQKGKAADREPVPVKPGSDANKSANKG